MQAATEYRTDQRPLWRIANMLVIASLVTAVVYFSLLAYKHYWPIESTPAATIAPTVASADVTPCTAISADCASVTPQPATSGPHAIKTVKGSTLPLLANGARFAEGTDVQCYWATVYKVDCESVKQFGEQYKFNQGDN